MSTKAQREIAHKLRVFEHAEKSKNVAFTCRYFGEDHPYADCCWIFMTPFAYNVFLDILKVNLLPALSAVWVPLP